jgi:multidrug efflux pump
MSAALRGAREIGFTVISLTVSLIAVFIPLLFMTGLVGRMFREFALTLTIAVVTSAIVSLTLTPMMCARMLTKTEEKQGGRIARKFNDYVDRTLEFYRESLEWVIQRQKTTLLVTAITLAASSRGPPRRGPAVRHRPRVRVPTAPSDARSDAPSR